MCIIIPQSGALSTGKSRSAYFSGRGMNTHGQLRGSKRQESGFSAQIQLFLIGRIEDRLTKWTPKCDNSIANFIALANDTCSTSLYINLITERVRPIFGTVRAQCVVCGRFLLRKSFRTVSFSGTEPHDLRNVGGLAAGSMPVLFAERKEILCLRPAFNGRSSLC